MSKIKVAVIGCGRMGKMHIENLQRYFPQVQIAAVIDHHPDEQWLNKHAITNIHQSPEVALNDKSIQAVVIAASSSEHVKLISLSAESKKHIFCEKPISFDIQGIQEAIASVKRHQVKLQVGFNRRFDPSFAKIRENVKQGTIGRLYSVRITNRDPRRPDLAFIPRSGGLFLDFHVHDFDTIRFVTGQEIESVQAFGSNLVDPEIGQFGDIDTAVISCTLQGGGVASIDSCREAVYGYDQRLEVLGSKGAIESQNQIDNTLFYSEKDKIYSDPLKTTFVERYREAYLEQMRSFLGYLSNDDVKSPVDGHDTLQAVACAIAAKRSFDEHRAVQLQEIL